MTINLGNLNSVIDLIAKKTDGGTKIGKAVKSSFFNVLGCKPSSDYWTDGINQDSFVSLLGTLSFAETIDELNEAYAKVGFSCMKDEPVGEFYVFIGLKCAIIQGARGLIDPENKCFVSCYGPNHYVLRSILILLGYSEVEVWPDPVRVRMLTSTFSTYFPDSEINSFLKHVSLFISGEEYESVMEHVRYQEWDEESGMPYSSWLQDLVLNYHVGERRGSDGKIEYYSVRESPGYFDFGVPKAHFQGFIPHLDGMND